MILECAFVQKWLQEVFLCRVNPRSSFSDLHREICTYCSVPGKATSCSSSWSPTGSSTAFWNFQHYWMNRGREWVYICQPVCIILALCWFQKTIQPRAPNEWYYFLLKVKVAQSFTQKSSQSRSVAMTFISMQISYVCVCVCKKKHMRWKT